MAELLAGSGVAVVDDLERVAEPPEILHLQHRVESLTALARFSGVPAIQVCHGFRPWQESPIRHPRIARYVAIDEATRDRLATEAEIPSAEIATVPNAVDLERFRPRSPLPPRPRRALALHHRLHEGNGAAVLREACEREGIELEIAGAAAGRPWPRPEERMGEFDLLFGHGRVALEGLASGLAVIVFGPEGLGPCVDSAAFDRLRALNFGFRAQTGAISVPALRERIRQYDPTVSAAVSRRARGEAGLERALDAWLEVYDEASRSRREVAVEAERSALLRELRRLSIDLREIERLGSPAYEEGRRAGDLATRRLDELERFRESVVSSRSFRWAERLRRLAGRAWVAPNGAPPSPRPRLLALLVFRDEMEYLPGWFENVPPEVDGVVALDDGSIDGSAEFVAQQPSVLELVRLPRRDEADWDDGANHRRVTEAAMRHRPGWLLGVDADERLESGFGERVRALIESQGAAGPGAYYVGVRELWDRPDRFRADGVWGAKRSARLFRARPDHEFDPRRLHGVWAPLNARTNGDFPLADLLLYHLRMLTPERRRRRRERYEALDAAAAFQQIGYAYLTDETGLELAELPPGRSYRPLGR
jgi:hypothetical protein